MHTAGSHHGAKVGGLAQGAAQLRRTSDDATHHRQGHRQGEGLGLGLGYCSSPFTVENQDLRHDRPSGRGAGGGSSPNNCSRMDPPLASHCCLRAFRTLLICLTAFFRLVIDTSMSFHHAGCPLPGGAGHGGSSLVIRLRKKFPKKTGQWITMLLNAIQGKAFKWIT